MSQCFGLCVIRDEVRGEREKNSYKREREKTMNHGVLAVRNRINYFFLIFIRKLVVLKYFKIKYLHE